jgi:LacI family transcriptional regulator
MIQAIPTVRLIAEICAVSRSTVSLALRRDPRISAHVTDLVRKTAFQLGYSPDPKVSQVMSQIARKEKPQKNCLGILLGDFFKRPDPWREYPWLARFRREIAARAGEYGYTVDTFWLGEPGMTGRRMKQILLTRAIEGLIAFDHLQVQVEIDFDFSPFASSVIGHGLAKTGLDAVGGNFHNDLSRALHKTIEQGYQTPGLAIDNSYTHQSFHAWKSSYCYQESIIAERERIPVCVYDRDNLVTLGDWYSRHRPDAILGLSWSTYRDLQTLGLNIPNDVGFVTLLQDDRTPNVTGMELQYKAIATRAVDLVAERLRRFEKGLPATPELILIDGTWSEGRTLLTKVARVSVA